MNAQADFDNYFAKLVTDGCNVPEAWLRSADRLLSSAAAVMEMIKAGRKLHVHGLERTPAQDELASRAVQSISTALMLYAFAVECLMKAYFVGGDDALYVNGKMQPFNIVPKHDLVKLSGVVGLHDAFDDEQLAVLDKLTLFIEVGRYPAPFRADGYGHQLQPDGWMKTRGAWGYAEEGVIYRILVALYGKLGMEPPTLAEVLL